MSPSTLTRDRLRSALRAGVVAIPAALLAACAASPPPGSLPAPETTETTETAAPEAPPAATGGLWAIRLHSGEDSVAAEEAASTARERFDGPVSVVDEAGEYHVQLGEFATEAQARAFLGVARERGFPGASVRPLPPAPAPTTATPAP